MGFFLTFGFFGFIVRVHHDSKTVSRAYVRNIEIVKVRVRTLVRARDSVDGIVRFTLLLGSFVALPIFPAHFGFARMEEFGGAQRTRLRAAPDVTGRKKKGRNTTASSFPGCMHPITTLYISHNFIQKIHILA